jgi:hypothetical protein
LISGHRRVVETSTGLMPSPSPALRDSADVVLSEEIIQGLVEQALVRSVEVDCQAAELLLDLWGNVARNASFSDTRSRYSGSNSGSVRNRLRCDGHEVRDLGCISVLDAEHGLAERVGFCRHVYMSPFLVVYV